MKYDIKEVDLSLLQRFYDMANCADASYALLHFIEEKKAYK